mgnify:FL=1
MTWKEFKEVTERRGVKDDDEIFYIDAYLNDDHIRYEHRENGWEIWA